MRVAVLGASDSWYTLDLQRAAETLGWSLQTAPFSQIQVTQSGRPEGAEIRCGDLKLDRFDAVLVRTMPPGSLEQVVFRMDALASLAEQDVIVCNPPKSIEAAVDKFLCNSRLARAGLRTPPTVTCQDFDSAMEAFHRFGRDVVVKPIFGGEGRGLIRLTDEGLAHRTLRTLEQLSAVLYLQPFLPHRFDLRLLCCGERVFGMRRHCSTDWRSNISQGGRGEPLEVTPEFAELAIRATRAVGAEVAGVDVLLPSDEAASDRSALQGESDAPNAFAGFPAEPIVLEVNAVPGWRALARVTKMDIAGEILRHVQRLRANSTNPPEIDVRVGETDQ